MVRMAAALRIFKMMSVDAHPPHRKQPKPGKLGATEHMIELSGCSTIMSLPLPNSGNYSGEVHCGINGCYVLPEITFGVFRTFA